jgi:hypothetical protein
LSSVLAGGWRRLRRRIDHLALQLHLRLQARIERHAGWQIDGLRGIGRGNAPLRSSSAT